MLCDQTLAGGGWTVIQKRFDGSVDFDRTFAEYESGFGNLQHGEFWFGLDKVYGMLSQSPHELYIELTDFANDTGYARYASFLLGSRSEQYVLTVSGYSGTAGNSLLVPSPPGHSGSTFHTKDRDNPARCATTIGGGWWYHALCQFANVNGNYKQPSDSGPYGIIWIGWGRGVLTPLRESRLLIRPASEPQP